MSNFCLLKITRKSHISFSPLIGLAEGSASVVVSIISVKRTVVQLHIMKLVDTSTRLVMRFNLTFTDGRVHVSYVSVVYDNVPLAFSAWILARIILNGTIQIFIIGLI